MRHGIVEGEPGAFPEPVARLFRAIGRVFSRRGGSEPSRRSPGGAPSGSAPDGGADAVDVSDLDPVRPDRAEPPSRNER